MFFDALDRRPLLLDGAMGTELVCRGQTLPAPLWSAAALIDAPALVEQIHRDYLAAGADIIVANTFRTNPAALRAAGRAADGPALNGLAVRLARAATGDAVAANRQVIVAASVAPSADCYRPDLAPGDSALAREHNQMLAWLAAARPDLAWIETMNSTREALGAAAAAQSAGLSFAISFMLNERGELLGGDSLDSAIRVIDALAPLAIGLNCIPPRGISAHLPRLRQLTSRPIAVYAHIGNAAALPGWSFGENASPPQYAEYAAAWRDMGANIIGGCCGTTPAHVAACRGEL